MNWKMELKKLYLKERERNRLIKYILLFLALFAITQFVFAQQKATTFSTIEKDFKHPPQSAKPWTFWYWMHGAVSKAGITADLQAMKEIGLDGAYLMPIQDTLNPLLVTPAIRQLSAAWWQMVRFAMQEADRLGLQLAMHVSDGFALAGGPWITPELSMQKLVWSKINAKGGTTFNSSLPQPETVEGYYKDIAVYAYPNPTGKTVTTQTVIPVITTSRLGVNADFLIKETSKESFRGDSSCWIQYAFTQPFTCRSILIKTGGTNYPSHRLIMQSSDDGVNFTTVQPLSPPRHGWQDTDADVTHSIPATTAKYFRFVYNREGSEPGAEDLDAAKWKPVLKVRGIQLSSEPVVNQYESKNGEVWRVSLPSTNQQLPSEDCVPSSKLINITAYYNNGKLNWKVPAGNWTMIRMGHTSTGHKNETAGGGKGLECDKFSEKSITLQFNSWFGKTFEMVGKALAKKVLKGFHIDSWECGSQNWSAGFSAEFKKRRGYDLLPYLPVMAGIPIDNAAKSEKVLHDVRETIAELVNDVFYKTLTKLAHEKGCNVTAESVAPTMMSDGMLHYGSVDVPMGEFWLRSPTHDKPNDMMDAISGAHVYGKNIIQSESFTELRMAWDEHPGMLKTVGDRNFALGINRLVFHVFTHNPWIDKKPGVTLDGVGLYFQRDQTWFKQAKAWLYYIQRCQALLQMGKPVADIAVFTGDELPRRSVLPDRLVNTFPGIFGGDRVAAEKKRLANEGQPMRSIPDGVNHSANMADPEDWVNPLNGYAYDSFNPDALLRLAAVKDGRIVLPGGASYKLLVLPAAMKMNPGNIISNASVKKIIQLVQQGATVLMDSVYLRAFVAGGVSFSFIADTGNVSISVFGKGKFVLTPYTATDFKALGLEKDFKVLFKDDSLLAVAYTHRKIEDTDIYFVSNQSSKENMCRVSFRVGNRIPKLWNAVTGEEISYPSYKHINNRTEVSLGLYPGASIFIVFKENDSLKNELNDWNCLVWDTDISKDWKVKFDTAYGGPKEIVTFTSLTDWTKHSDLRIKYYSGTAVYSNNFVLDYTDNVYISFKGVHDLATVKINGIDCGTLWTPPFMLDIKHAVKKGNNTIEIEVTNTWRNRLIGDHALPKDKQLTFTTAPYRLEGKPLLPAGLTGEIKVIGY